MMLDQTFSDQVRLLITVLPQVHKEECFALKGGTAINLFIHDMPRLSVDIDLAYLPLTDRETSLQNIDTALKRIGAIVHFFWGGGLCILNIYNRPYPDSLRLRLWESWD